MKRIVLCITLFLVFSIVSAQIITGEHKQRAKDLVKQMTLKEKLDYIGGEDKFFIRAIPRLGIPKIQMADGPQGIREQSSPSTLYPSGMAAAATWNRSIVYDMGKGIGQDARSRGVHIMLGPGVNIYRSPLCGRNFEYFGEDPYLASETAVEYIKGMQSQRVVSTIKHFLANNQEGNRWQTSSDIDERTMREVYLQPFYNAVKKANVGAIMSGYNLVNSVYMTENKALAVDILRDEWGFDGIYMSDWGATHSSVGAANGGLDIEMPSGTYMNYESLIEAINNGVVTEEIIDLKVQHILQTLIAFGFLDKEQKDSSILANNPFSNDLSLRMAREAIVMLKNENNVLPLKGKSKILLCGPNADVVLQGAGSGSIYPIDEELVSVRKGLKEIGTKYTIKTLDVDAGLTSDLGANGEFYTGIDKKTSGLVASFYVNKECNGDPVRVEIDKVLDCNWGTAAPLNGVPEDGFSISWGGYFFPKETGKVTFKMYGDDGYRLFIDDKEILSDWKNHGTTDREAVLDVVRGKSYKIRVDYYDNSGGANVKLLYGKQDLKEWVKDMQKADAVIFCGGFSTSTEGEGNDRKYELPKKQIELLNLIGENNKKSIAIFNSGGSFDMRGWSDKIKTILMAFYPGQKGGVALAEIITGKVSPSGKLPFTVEKKYSDNPCANNYFDNVNPKGNKYYRVSYNEGLFVGYRGFERNKVEPLYPFGYGLTYSEFEYSDINVKKDGENVVVAFDLKNVGKYDASEVAQVYVRDVESSVLRPLKELKGYEKIHLKKGEKQSIKIVLNKDAFSFWDVNRDMFVVEPGTFEILVGSSSSDIRLTDKIEL